MCRALIAFLLFSLSACASLRPLTEGSAPGLAWHTADVALERKTSDTRSWWEYSFSLVVQETQGTALTFNEVKTTVYQPGLNPWSPTYRGVWELPANASFRIPLSVGVGCLHGVPNCTGSNVPIPLWRITMIGRTAGGEPIRYVIDLRMPADPPAPPSVISTDVRAIDLVQPRAPATQGSPPAGKR
jgi:hypothetical protein